MAKEICHIISQEVSVITDLQGNVTNVVCPHFRRMTGGCGAKLKKMSDEKTSLVKGVLKILADNVADTRMTYCEFTGPLT